MIEALHLCSRYGRSLALDDVSFHVHPGEVVGLLGENGAGKSTCLRAIVGLIPRSAGEVRVLGMDPAKDGVAARTRIGYLPEGSPIYPEMRAAEYLRFRAALRGLRRQARTSAVERAIDQTGLNTVSRKLVGRLSKGFRQRLALADALLGDPEVLVLDEPTEGLDPNQVREVRQLIAGIRESRAILLSSHILAEVEAVCSRVVVLHQGRKVGEGTLDELGAATADTVSTVIGVVGSLETVRAAVEMVPDVVRVHPVRADHDVVTLRITCARERANAVRAGLAAAVVRCGLGLVELSEERAPLEEIFSRLTLPPVRPTDHGDPAAVTDRGDHAAVTDRGDHAAVTDRGDHAAVTDRGDHAAVTDRGDHAAVTDRGDHAARSEP